MGLKYSFIHIVVHLLLIATIYFVFKLDWFNLIIVFIGGTIVDLDHFSLWLKKGIRGYLYLRAVTEFGKPRKYPLHNFLVLLLSTIGSLLVFTQFFTLGIFLLGLSLHLWFDLLEDIIIFRMDTKHWKL